MMASSEAGDQSTEDLRTHDGAQALRQAAKTGPKRWPCSKVGGARNRSFRAFSARVAS